MSKKISKAKQVLPLQLLFSIKANQPQLYRSIIVNQLDQLSGSHDPDYTIQDFQHDLVCNNVLSNKLSLFKLLANTPIHQN